MKGEDRYTIAGTVYRVIEEGTLEHDLQVLSLAQQAGITTLTQGDQEAPEDFARRILDGLTQSGAMLDLLGCLLIPDSVVDDTVTGMTPGDFWTPSQMRHTSAAMARVRTPEDKATIRGLVSHLMIRFFESGLVSLMTSAPSSVGAADVETSPASSPGPLPPLSDGEIGRA